MKVLKKILVWAAVSLMLQTCVLLYLNDIFFVPNHSITFKKIDLDSKENNNKSSIDIPSDVSISTIKISDDCNFMAYIQDKQLKVRDLNSGKVETVTNSDMYVNETTDINGKETIQPVYEWIAERDRLLVGYAYKSKDGARSLGLLSYDAENNISREESKFSDKFKGVMEGRYISSIKSSPLTSTIYIKIDGKNKATKLYRIDINSDIHRTESGVDLVGNMAESQNNDKLYYENANSSTGNEYTVIKTVYGEKTIRNYSYVVPGIYALGDNQSYNRVLKSNNDTLKIVGISSSDKVVVASINKDNYVNKLYYSNNKYDIFYTAMLPPAIDWGVSYKDLLMDSLGDVFINNTKDHYLINLLGEKKQSYTGDLVQITDDYIISSDGERIMFKKLKIN